MALGFFGCQGLRGHADLPAYRLGNQPERHALFCDGVERFVPGTPFECQAENARGIQPVHGTKRSTPSQNKACRSR